MKFIFIILLGIIISGCASKRENMTLSDNFQNNPGAVLVTEIAGFENPQYHVDEAQGSNSGSMLLDALVSVTSSLITNSSAAAGREAVNCIDVSVVLEDDYFKPFMKTLQIKGFTAKKTDIIKVAELKEGETKEEKYAPYDFRFLQKHGARYAFVLEPHFFGAKHRGTFSNPMATTIVSIYAVNLESNILEGYFRTAVEVKVQDDWEQNDYQGFVKATVEALETALKQAHTFMFEAKQCANS